jgi:uncharacterized protein YaiI (UPF0178 family)
LEIYVDADGCPVKEEVYRVAKRYGLSVILVANARMRVPRKDWVRLVLVDDQFNAADDWIVEHIAEDDIVISGDIPLASRCLTKGARVLSPRGRVFRENSIGNALANRDFNAHLRELGAITGGPEPFGRPDRSRFLQRLDEIIQAVRRRM